MKKLLALFLVVLMSIDSFAAIVSDNDGSAFVTKAEFESLKENFAEQIENYNTSIDSKIDGAIASYLAGINLANKNYINGFVEVKTNSDYIFGRVRDYGGITKQLWNDAMIQLVSWGFNGTYAGGLQRYPFKSTRGSSQEGASNYSRYVMHNYALTPLWENANTDLIGYVFDATGVVRKMLLDDNITWSGFDFEASDYGGTGTYSWILRNVTFNAASRQIDVTYDDLMTSVGRFYVYGPHVSSWWTSNFNSLVVSQKGYDSRSSGEGASWNQYCNQSTLHEVYNSKKTFVHTTGSEWTQRNIYNNVNVPIYAYMDGETQLETFADPLNIDGFINPETGNKYTFDKGSFGYDNQIILMKSNNTSDFNVLAVGNDLWTEWGTSASDESWASTDSQMVPKVKLKNTTTVTDLKPTVKGYGESTAKFNNLSQFKNHLMKYTNSDGDDDYARYYGGVPLFNQNETGEKCEFKIKFDGTAGRKIRLYVKKYEFPNAFYSTTSSAWTATNPDSNKSYLDDLIVVTSNANTTNTNKYIDLNLNTTYTITVKDPEKNVPYFLRWAELNGSTEVAGGWITYLSDFVYTTEG